MTVNLVEPGKLYGDRINQLDLRFAKVLNFGRTRTNVGDRSLQRAEHQPDHGATTRRSAPAWLTPTAVMPARFVKLSVQIDW